MFFTSISLFKYWLTFCFEVQIYAFLPTSEPLFDKVLLKMQKINGMQWLTVVIFCVDYAMDMLQCYVIHVKGAAGNRRSVFCRPFWAWLSLIDRHG